LRARIPVGTPVLLNRPGVEETVPARVVWQSEPRPDGTVLVGVELAAPSDYFRHYPTNQVLEPTMSSWGYGGYSEVWLNGANDWIYRHLHKMAQRMTELATTHPQVEPLRTRALNQLARELLLAQSSDWAFILKNQTHTAYAYRRLHDHLARFSHLADSIQEDRIDASWLTEVEAKDNLFPFLDYRIYATTHAA